MAATRLRKTFHYPADDSDEGDEPRDMDEEEQEKLIKKLREEDDERNEEWKRIFLAIPTVAATTYIPALIMSRLIKAKLLSLLCMTSLVATAYILIFIPNSRADSSKSARPKRGAQTRLGPIKQYISLLNGGLSFFIALNAIAFKDKKGVHEGFWVLLLLPVVSFSFVLLARRLMLSVDVDELEDLKYEYKGA